MIYTHQSITLNEFNMNTSSNVLYLGNLKCLNVNTPFQDFAWCGLTVLYALNWVLTIGLGLYVISIAGCVQILWITSPYMLHLNMAISSAKMCILLLGVRLERSNCVLGKVLSHKMITNGTRVTTMPSGVVKVSRIFMIDGLQIDNPLHILPLNMIISCIKMYTPFQNFAWSGPNVFQAQSWV